MPSTRISCTLDIWGIFEGDRNELIGAIKARLASSTSLKDVEYKPVRLSDGRAKLAFQVTVAGGPDSDHVASIEALVAHALGPFKADDRPINAAIETLQFERLPN